MIYKRLGIDRIFTETVTPFLSQGFQISTQTKCKQTTHEPTCITCIDLYKAGTLVRVQLCRTCHAYYSLLVKRREPFEICDLSSDERIVGNSTFEIISEARFYPVDDILTFCARVYSDEATAKAAQSKRNTRRELRRVDYRRELPASAKTIVLKWLRNKPQMKTCRLNEIESVSRVNKRTDDGNATPEIDYYEIKARGRVFRLLA